MTDSEDGEYLISECLFLSFLPGEPGHPGWTRWEGSRHPHCLWGRVWHVGHRDRVGIKTQALGSPNLQLSRLPVSPGVGKGAGGVTPALGCSEGLGRGWAGLGPGLPVWKAGGASVVTTARQPLPR